MSTQTKKYFNLTLHISVIADVKDIVQRLNIPIEIVEWNLSAHTRVFNKHPTNVEIINQETWKILDKNIIKQFQLKYDEFLSQFDGFIVAHPISFCQLYEKYNKPIIIVNTVRYEIPYCWNHNLTMVKELHLCLQRLNHKKLLHIVSNNKADQRYFKKMTGLDSVLIPSLCLYTNMKHNGNDDRFIVYNSKINNTIPNHSKIVYKNDILKPGYKWNELTKFKGIIHIPYEISTMSIYEQYSANIPLIFPSKQFLKNLLKNKRILFYGPYFKNNYPVQFTPFIKFPDWIDFWVDRADYYDDENMKYITYYNSFEEIIDIIEKTDFHDISNKMRRWNQIRNNRALHNWNDVYQNIENTKESLISYNSLPILCNHIIDIYYNENQQPIHTYPGFSPKDVKKNDIVFIKTDLIDKYIPQLKLIKHPYYLITGSSDITPKKEIINLPNLQQWFGQHLPYNEPKIHPLPIGFNENFYKDKNQEIVWKIRNEIISNKQQKINKLCIRYFSQTHSSRKLVNHIENKDFVISLPCLPFDEYLRQIGKYRYVLCLRGNGLDTHGFYEILAMGGIPVIDDDDYRDFCLYTNYPCIRIKKWDNLSLETLECKDKFNDIDIENAFKNLTVYSVENEIKKHIELNWMLCGEGQINFDTSFGREIYRLTKSLNVNTIVEIGTWNGEGTTAILGNGILNNPNGKLYSLESDINQYKKAITFWSKLKKETEKINLIYGRIVEDNEVINWKEMKEKDDILNFLECSESEVEKWFLKDIDNIKKCPNVLSQLPEYIDILLLDGGEFTTWNEFQKLKNRITQYIIINDTKTFKNMEARKEIINHPGIWNVIKDERNDGYGYLIAKKLRNYR